MDKLESTQGNLLHKTLPTLKFVYVLCQHNGCVKLEVWNFGDCNQSSYINKILLF